MRAPAGRWPALAWHRWATGRRTQRAGLVDLQRARPELELDLRYAGARNVTGKPLPGYCEPWAMMLRRPARDLARVQRGLRRRGLGLKVLDAYRPARASRALVRWARRTGRGHLVGTYIARAQQPQPGLAVDLTLVRRRDGRQLPMGTRYDHLGPRAQHAQRPRAGPAQPADPDAGDGALRLHELPPRVVALRAPRHEASRYLDLTLGC